MHAQELSQRKTYCGCEHLDVDVSLARPRASSARLLPIFIKTYNVPVVQQALSINLVCSFFFA